MKYAIAFFGSLLYNYVLFVIAKNNCDKAETSFDYQKYFKMNWDNWGLTILVAPVLVLYLPDIVELLNQRLNTQAKLLDVYYLAAGPLSEVILFGMFKLIGWKQTWVAPVHK